MIHDNEIASKVVNFFVLYAKYDILKNPHLRLRAVSI